ncbi:hypothetical protein ACO2KH_05640 [Leptospira terpstrae]|uniref:hypothetical protein n=1 Tax=Leptospira terpstrae TaxID=293075 RepID=UPI003CFC3990
MTNSKLELENEWIQSKSLGPLIDENSIQWNFIANVKVDNLESIHGYEVNGSKISKQISGTSKNTKGILSLSS